MKKQLFIVILSIIACLGLAFGLAACSGNDDQSNAEQSGSDEGETEQDGSEHVHNYNGGVVIIERPTCTEDGIMELTCDCGYTYTAPIPATEHKFTDYISNNDATCTEDGTKTAVCNNGCGETNTITDEGSATGHIFTNYISNDDATCTENGTKTAVCDNGCGETDTITDEENLATGHTPGATVRENEVAATDTTAGSYDLVVYCAVCEEELSRKTVTFEATTGLYYTKSDDGTYCIVSGIGTATDTDIVIASEYEGLPVKEIAASAFENCSSLASISIPSSVTSIGDGAFSGCSSLTSIAIPDSITSIGDGAFSGCGSLTSITIPNSVTSIGASAFENCSSLTSITIPDSVTSIGWRAFMNCSSLETVYYTGSQEQWDEISISSGNDYLRNAEIVVNE